MCPKGLANPALTVLTRFWPNLFLVNVPFEVSYWVGKHWVENETGYHFVFHTIISSFCLHIRDSFTIGLLFL